MCKQDGKLLTMRIDRTHFGWIWAVILALHSIAFAQQPKHTPDKKLSHKIDQIFSEWNKSNSPGCALAIIKDKQIIYERGYGIANLEYGVPITPVSAFYVGSIAKQFTAMSIALLAQEGKLSLDDNIRKYVPEIPDYGTPITIRQLIHHTSGLRDFWDLIGQAGRRWDDAYTLKDVIETAAQQKELNCKPGEKHLYSNTGYMLLAIIVQRASGQSLREFADAHIFKPLGMLHTRFQDDHSALIPGRVYGYVPQEGNSFGVYAINNDLVGAGGLWTTVEDLARWDANFYSAKVGGQALIQQLQVPGTGTDGVKFDYAFGLHIDEYKGVKRVRHGGVFAGYRAEMIRFPEKKFSVAVLCNSSSVTPTKLANEIADMFLIDQIK